jgi:basic membrane protein A
MKSPDCSREEVFCVGLVTDTLGIEDNGVNQDAWAGMQNLKNYGTVDQADYIESVDTRDYGKNIAYFAEHGYDVIVTSGIGLHDETLHAAALYENIIFVGINQPVEKAETKPNIIPVTFAEDQMGFFAGVLAARVTKTNIVGAVCEKSGIDSMWRYCEGFRAGVKFSNKDIKVSTIYNDGGDSEKLFLDEEWGRESAQGFIRRGADVIFAAGGVTGQGALRAAVESQVKAIGAERNQSAALGESNEWVITSIYGNAQFEVERILRTLRGENLGAQTQSPIKFIPLGPRLPENLTPEFKGLLIELWSQRIRTNVTTMKP